MQAKRFEDILERDGYLIYRIKGVSMMPLIDQRKDLVTIRKIDRPYRRYDIVLYKRDSGKYVLHRILRKRKTDYVICGDNCWQLEYGITDRHILGVMTELIREGRSIPLTSLYYRTYVHLWCDFFGIRAILLWLRDFPYRLKRNIVKRLKKI